MSRSDEQTLSSDTYLHYGEEIPFKSCGCGDRMELKTYWKNDDPGRRYHKCPNFGAAKCGFWEWYDPATCARSKKIIPGLFKKIKDLESKAMQTVPANDAANDQLHQMIQGLKRRNTGLSKSIVYYQRVCRILGAIVVCLLFGMIVLMCCSMSRPTKNASMWLP